MSFTSFECSHKGNWSYNDSHIRSNVIAKTGDNYFNLQLGSISRSNIGASTSNRYLLSFWARSSGTNTSWSFLGQTENLNSEWKFVQREITNSSLSIQSANVFIDELRLHPINSHMSTYTYIPLIGVSSITNPTNITTYYDYDDFGRLKNVRDENKKLINVYDYHYKSF